MVKKNIFIVCISIIILFTLLIAINNKFNTKNQKDEQAILDTMNRVVPDIPSENSTPKEKIIYYKDINEEGFCGSSTHGSCVTNIDCITGGCSAEICYSKNDEGYSGISNCMALPGCYNSITYNVSCGCVNNECQWKK